MNDDAETLGQQQLEVSEEFDSLGRSTGVEWELTSEPEEPIQDPFDPEEIEVVTRNPTVDLLLSRIRDDRIDLTPDFQRFSGIWTEKTQSRLIESLLLRIPLPTLYAAEDEDERWAVVDGIQRLTTIARFIEPDSINAEPLTLRKLEYLSKSYDGARFSDLPGRLQTRLRETELVLHLIRRSTPEEVKFNIFARINTGGSPLSQQELRHALIPGRARELLRIWAESDDFTQATAGSVRSERMADREMVLRFIAFRLTDPMDYRERDFDKYLRRAMHQINTLPSSQLEGLQEDFRRSMRAAPQILGEYAFRKRYRSNDRRLPINKALFEAQAVNLAKLSDDDLELLRFRREKVSDRFMELMANNNFERAISQGTGDASKVRLRFERAQAVFTEALQ